MPQNKSSELPEPETTANGKYRYDAIYYGKTLNEWVQACHVENCRYYKWVYRPLVPGAFGFDNLACGLSNLFALYEKDGSCTCPLSSYDAIHEAWKENYEYWRDNKPWLKKSGAKALYRRSC